MAGERKLSQGYSLEDSSHSDPTSEPTPQKPVQRRKAAADPKSGRKSETEKKGGKKSPSKRAPGSEEREIAADKRTTTSKKAKTRRRRGQKRQSKEDESSDSEDSDSALDENAFLSRFPVLGLDDSTDSESLGEKIKTSFSRQPVPVRVPIALEAAAKQGKCISPGQQTDPGTGQDTHADEERFGQWGGSLAHSSDGGSFVKERKPSNVVFALEPLRKNAKPRCNGCKRSKKGFLYCKTQGHPAEFFSVASPKAKTQFLDVFAKFFNAADFPQEPVVAMNMEAVEEVAPLLEEFAQRQYSEESSDEASDSSGEQVNGGIGAVREHDLDAVSDSDKEWVAAHPSQAVWDRALRNYRATGRSNQLEEPAFEEPEEANMPPIFGDQFDEAGLFEFDLGGHARGPGIASERSLPPDLEERLPAWMAAHVTTSNGNAQPNIRHRNGALMNRVQQDGSSDSYSDWGSESLSEEEAPANGHGGHSPDSEATQDAVTAHGLCSRSANGLRRSSMRPPANGCVATRFPEELPIDGQPGARVGRAEEAAEPGGHGIDQLAEEGARRGPAGEEGVMPDHRLPLVGSDSTTEEGAASELGAPEEPPTSRRGQESQPVNRTGTSTGDQAKEAADRAPGALDAGGMLAQARAPPVSRVQERRDTQEEEVSDWGPGSGAEQETEEGQPGKALQQGSDVGHEGARTGVTRVAHLDCSPHNLPPSPEQAEEEGTKNDRDKGASCDQEGETKTFEAGERRTADGSGKQRGGSLAGAKASRSEGAHLKQAAEVGGFAANEKIEVAATNTSKGEDAAQKKRDSHGGAELGEGCKAREAQVDSDGSMNSREENGNIGGKREMAVQAVSPGMRDVSCQAYITSSSEEEDSSGEDEGGDSEEETDSGHSDGEKESEGGAAVGEEQDVKQEKEAPEGKEDAGEAEPLAAKQTMQGDSASGADKESVEQDDSSSGRGSGRDPEEERDRKGQRPIDKPELEGSQESADDFSSEEDASKEEELLERAVVAKQGSSGEESGSGGESSDEEGVDNDRPAKKSRVELARLEEKGSKALELLAATRGKVRSEKVSTSESSSERESSESEEVAGKSVPSVGEAKDDGSSSEEHSSDEEEVKNGRPAKRARTEARLGDRTSDEATVSGKASAEAEPGELLHTSPSSSEEAGYDGSGHVEAVKASVEKSSSGSDPEESERETDSKEEAHAHRQTAHPGTSESEAASSSKEPGASAPASGDERATGKEDGSSASDSSSEFGGEGVEPQAAKDRPQQSRSEAGSESSEEDDTEQARASAETKLAQNGTTAQVDTPESNLDTSKTSGGTSSSDRGGTSGSSPGRKEDNAETSSDSEERPVQESRKAAPSVAAGGGASLVQSAISESGTDSEDGKPVAKDGNLAVGTTSGVHASSSSEVSASSSSDASDMPEPGQAGKKARDEGFTVEGSNESKADAEGVDEESSDESSDSKEFGQAGGRKQATEKGVEEPPADEGSSDSAGSAQAEGQGRLAGKGVTKPPADEQTPDECSDSEEREDRPAKTGLKKDRHPATGKASNRDSVPSDDSSDSGETQSGRAGGSREESEEDTSAARERKANSAKIDDGSDMEKQDNEVSLDSAGGGSTGGQSESTTEESESGSGAEEEEGPLHAEPGERGRKDQKLEGSGGQSGRRDVSSDSSESESESSSGSDIPIAKLADKGASSPRVPQKQTEREGGRKQASREDEKIAPKPGSKKGVIGAKPSIQKVVNGQKVVNAKKGGGKVPSTKAEHAEAPKATSVRKESASEESSPEEESSTEEESSEAELPRTGGKMGEKGTVGKSKEEESARKKSVSAQGKVREKAESTANQSASRKSKGKGSDRLHVEAAAEPNGPPAEGKRKGAKAKTEEIVEKKAGKAKGEQQAEVSSEHAPKKALESKVTANGQRKESAAPKEKQQSEASRAGLTDFEGEPALPCMDLLMMTESLPPNQSADDILHTLLSQHWQASVEQGPVHTLSIPTLNTGSLTRHTIRRFANCTSYVNYHRLWVLLEAWKEIRSEFAEWRRAGKKGKNPLTVSPSTLLDVRGVSQPADGFSYVELSSQSSESSLPEKDEVLFLEEVRFVDDSQPGFGGAAGHWEKSGQTVLAFAHRGSFRKGTVKVRGYYRPESKAVSIVHVCSLTTLSRSWGALHEVGTKPLTPLILNPENWGPGMHGSDLMPELRRRHQPRVTQDFFWTRERGPTHLHWLRNWVRKGLVNEEQVEAIAVGLLKQERLALIQGPPGTGKTSTIIALISAIRVADPNARILLCAPSNGAVDECTRRLLANTMLDREGNPYTPDLQRILRVGPPVGIHVDCLRVSMDAHVDSRRGASSAAAGSSRIGEDKIRENVLKASRIVCATLSGSGMETVADKMPVFDVVIIDEAAQAVEPEALIALNRVSLTGRAILVGDPCQLPATVMQHPQFPYDTSLFERLQSAGSRCTLLRTQYRLHPAIRSFPNTRFYGGLLKDGPNIAARTTIFGDNQRTSCEPQDLLRVQSGDVQFNLGPYRFLDVRWSSEEHGKGGSTRNRLEATVVASVVSGLVKALTQGVPVQRPDGLIEVRRFDVGGDRGADQPFSVGVITPYSLQKRLIQRLLSERGVSPETVEVDTVDGFQGREMDAIVLSTVRASKNGADKPGETIGFVSDRRRMNVALTRARHCLLIVGDSKTLQARSEDWRELIEDAKARNCFEEIEKDGKSPRKTKRLKKEDDDGGGDGKGGAKRKLDMRNAGGQESTQGKPKKRKMDAGSQDKGSRKERKDDSQQGETEGEEGAMLEGSQDVGKRSVRIDGTDVKRGGACGESKTRETEGQQKQGKNAARKAEAAPDSRTGKAGGEGEKPNPSQPAKESALMEQPGGGKQSTTKGTKNPSTNGKQANAAASEVSKHRAVPTPKDAERKDKARMEKKQDSRGPFGASNPLAKGVSDAKKTRGKLGDGRLMKTGKKEKPAEEIEPVGKEGPHEQEAEKERRTKKERRKGTREGKREVAHREVRGNSEAGQVSSDTLDAQKSMAKKTMLKQEERAAEEEREPATASKSRGKRKRDSDAADLATGERPEKRPQKQAGHPEVLETASNVSGRKKRSKSRVSFHEETLEGEIKGDVRIGSSSEETNVERGEKVENRGSERGSKKGKEGRYAVQQAAQSLTDQKHSDGKGGIAEQVMTSEAALRSQEKPALRSILKGTSLGGKKGLKLRKRLQMAKHVQFEDAGRLVRVRFIPRRRKKQRGEIANGPSVGKPSKKREITFQRFIDLKREWGKAEPANGRFLKGGAALSPRAGGWKRTKGKGKTNHLMKQTGRKKPLPLFATSRRG